METLFNDLDALECDLVDCIGLIGLSVKTLSGIRYLEILIKGKNSAPAEVILQLPPGSQVIKKNYADVLES